MNFPSDLLYTKDHEWARLSGDEATIGITDHAQRALGDIVFCELPKVGRELKSHETFGVVESIKAVSDLFCPISGKVTAVNDSAVSDPALINREPQTGGWLIKLKLAEKDSLKTLMNADSYKAFVATLT